MSKLFLVLLMLSYSSISYADMVDVNKLADAIYKAEGGAKTRHPYGILAKYKHTTPRQACINTIRHKYADWVKAGRKGDFIDYLASRYAPINCDTDNGTNKYWAGNVKKFMVMGNSMHSMPKIGDSRRQTGGLVVQSV